jgi:heavy metal translocating P-type ATPase
LTGEAVPLHALPGTSLMSGTINVEGALEIRATATSQESQYARIVELVRSAAASKAPLQRLADRYAVWFTPAVLLVCAVAWVVSSDPMRVLAVLVVATPCPLILATPVAIIGGINRAAARQIVMKTGGALEQLSEVRSAVFDKTGTLTVGRPEVSRVSALAPFTEDEVLGLAGSLEQHSSHALARSVVDAARRNEASLSTPVDVAEQAGSGISGRVGDRFVAVGGRHYIAGRVDGGFAATDGASAGKNDGLQAHVAIDGALAGVIEFSDQVRPGAAELIESLRSLGVRRVLLLSGDHAPNVKLVAVAVGIDEAVGDLLPGAKLERIAALSEEGPVMMVGDGTNDAPALSRAAVGVALVGHGGGVTAEAADVLILNDDLSRVADAMSISARTMRIARQSIWVGLGLSGVAMIAAGAGFIAPVVGAMLQEGIDVAVIMNALRASTRRTD